MAKFFRLQLGSYTLEEMQTHSSGDGGDGFGEEGGVCATRSVSDLLNNTVYEFAKNDDAEIVVISGHNPLEIYDGVRVYPEAILKRFTGAEFRGMVADKSAWDLED